MYRNFQLAGSEANLIAYEWKIEKPKYVVCLIHGIGEHAGRYDRTGEAFKKSEIAMVGMDLRGHGLSSGKRGHAAPRISILNDIDRLMEYIQNEYLEIPIILYGHSLGGNIALDYRRRGTYRSIPEGYIITSPWIILQQKIPGYLLFLTKRIAQVKPDFQMSSKINPEVLGNVNIIAEQENQHLVHGKISVRTALDGVEIADALVNDKLEIGEPETLKPLLLMHGNADKICAPEGSRKLAELEKDLCRYIEWEGLYHEIHNGSPTDDGMDVIQSMIDWILNMESKNTIL